MSSSIFYGMMALSSVFIFGFRPALGLILKLLGFHTQARCLNMQNAVISHLLFSFNDLQFYLNYAALV